MPSGVLCSLCGPRTFTGASLTCATGSLQQRHRQVRQLLRQVETSPRRKPKIGSYRTLDVGKRRRYVHRLVIEILLGRPLHHDEHVHHKDGDKYNNHPNNLALLSAGEHTHITNTYRPVFATCPVCGRTYLFGGRNRRSSRTCSRRCGATLGWRRTRQRVRRRPSRPARAAQPPTPPQKRRRAAR